MTVLVGDRVLHPFDHALGTVLSVTWSGEVVRRVRVEWDDTPTKKASESWCAPGLVVVLPRLDAA